MITTVTRQFIVEINTDKEWQTGSSPGFAHFRNHYVDFENPFKEGLTVSPKPSKKGKENLAEWIPSIPETGKYAVYVSYQTVDNQHRRCTAHDIS